MKVTPQVAILVLLIVATARDSTAQIRLPRPMDTEQRLIEIDKEFPGFGGFWFDPVGNVHVSIGNLEDSTKIKAIVATELGRRGERDYPATILLRHFVFHQSSFGYTDLWNWKCLVGKSAVDSVPGFQSSGVRVVINKIRFGVADPKGIPALKRLTASLRIPDEAVLVELEDPFCTLEARSGILISPTDSITGEVLITHSHFFARDGDFIDSMTVTGPVPQRLDFWPLTRERAGLYEVGIDRPGYKPWRKTVRVDKDVCHVAPVAVTAKLMRK